MNSVEIQAIYNLYPQVKSTRGATAFDAAGVEVEYDVAAVAKEVARITPIFKNEEISVRRRAAYATEADPLFFKVQRGEATMEEWHSKIAEIKMRFPKEPA